MIDFPISGTLSIGLIYSLVTLGVYFSFRIIHFPDLTVDGSFPLGAACAATALIHGVSPLLAIMFAILGGIIAGLVTGILHVKLKIMGILASILTMLALYSVNIRIMGQPNISLLNTPTLLSNETTTLLILCGIVLMLLFCLRYFLSSHYGLALRVAGINPRMCHAYGVNVNKATVYTLMLSNGLVALAGALFAQMQSFADVSLGTGTIITGLASIIMGEALLGTKNIQRELLACLLGAILYRFTIAFALNTHLFGLQASDLNLVTAGLITFTLFSPQLRRLIIP